MTDPLRFAVGSDTRHATADAIVAHLIAEGHPVTSVGLAGTSKDPAPWPQVGEEVARMVSRGDADAGIVCCWTGTGVSIAANKVPGIRAALCGDPATARGARRWNDANVLAIGLSGTDPDVARSIVDAWLGVDAPDEEEVANIDHVTTIEMRAADRAAAEPR